MQVTDNTILITGGASGIGRGLAEAFHRLGNQVIISGRRPHCLSEVTAANPGMQSLQADIGTASGVQEFAARVLRACPTLNVLINNAGIMKTEQLQAAPAYLEVAEDTVATNLLGPIRLTAALLPHLLAQPRATVLTVSSGLAFVPIAMTPTYCATKAAIHSYCMSLRHQLEGTSTEIIEIVPPYVQTELTGAHQAADPTAMKLADFIAEVMAILTTRPEQAEIVVGRCEPMRFAAEHGNALKMFRMVNSMNA